MRQPSSVTRGELYSGLLDVTGVLMTYIVVVVINNFFTSHYVFRWRTAMNTYYSNNWQKLRTSKAPPSVCRRTR